MVSILRGSHKYNNNLIIQSSNIQILSQENKIPCQVSGKLPYSYGSANESSPLNESVYCPDSFCILFIYIKSPDVYNFWMLCMNRHGLGNCL